MILHLSKANGRNGFPEELFTPSPCLAATFFNRLQEHTPTYFFDTKHCILLSAHCHGLRPYRSNASEQLLRRCLPPRNCVQEGTLPGARGSHNRQDLAGPRLGCNVIQEHLGGGLSALPLGLGHNLRTPMRAGISNGEVSANLVFVVKQSPCRALP
jgi:hypothetical protein